MERERIVLGGGSRSWKVLAPPSILLALPERRGRRGPGDRPPAADPPAADPRGDLTPPPVSFGLVTELDPDADPTPDPNADPNPDPNADPTPPRPPRPTGPVQYKGDDLEAERGPGLGCFRFQLVVLALFVVLTPLSVAWDWPDAVSAVLLFAVIGLLLLTGQTIIFLLRLVAADRREPSPAAGECHARLSASSRTRPRRMPMRPTPTRPTPMRLRWTR